jgi:hypothetical protein
MVAYRFSLALLLGVLCHGSVSAQASTGTISGCVVDTNGAPVPGTLISIVGSSPAAVSDSLGRFIIESVPEGSYVLASRNVGWDGDVAFVELAPGRTVHVTLHSGVTSVPLDGTDPPLPNRSDLEAATSVLPQLLEHVFVRRFAHEHFGRPSRRSSILVWAPWIVDEAAVQIRSVAGFRVVRDCARCATAHSYTLEGGRIYTVDEQHLAISVRSLNTGTRQLEFEVDVAESETRRLFSTPGRYSLRLIYAFTPEGTWIPLEPRLRTW